MRFLIGLLTASALFVASLAQAVQMPGLYQVSEELLEQDSDARDRALSRAFGAVVWRLTGTSNLDAYPELKAYSADPQDLITGYRHRDSVLRVHFDANSVLSLLQQQGLAIWGEQRPLLLLWWTQQDAHGQQLFSSGQLKAEGIAKYAEHNGLPVIFPMADLQEQIFTDGLQLREKKPQVEQLLQRYAANVFLRVAVSDDVQQPSASWQLYEQGQIRQGTVEAGTTADLADAVFFDLAEYFINKYAVLPGEGESLAVQVNELDMQRFTLVEQTLQVFNAKLVSLQGGQGVWQVKALPEQLRSLFALQRMVELPVPEVVQTEPIKQEPQSLEVLQDGSQVQEPLVEAQPELSPIQAQAAVLPKIDLLFSWQ